MTDSKKTSTVHLAVDLGASSGRVIAAIYDGANLQFEELVRFSHGPVFVPEGESGELYWDVMLFWNEIQRAITIAVQKYGSFESIAVDSWAVDYGRFNEEGKLLSNPVSYRSDRTNKAPDKFWARMPAEEHYRATGIQFQKFNTIFQFVAEERNGPQNETARVRLIPDLLNFWLSGADTAEITNLSTTGLIDPEIRSFDMRTISALHEVSGLNAEELFAALTEPGRVIGTLREELLPTSYRGSLPKVVAVASHDTASAVAAIPSKEAQPLYISCGTWSLVGLEIEEPNKSEEARRANFTNELGVYGTTRFLKNVMGLWVFNEAVAHWKETGEWDGDLDELVNEAKLVEPRKYLIDINHDSLFSPGDMVSRIRALLEWDGQEPPENPAGYVRCILDSLAFAYQRAISEALEITGIQAQCVHMIGGGIQNELLCQITADVTGLEVVAGPVEATAIGNVGMQLVACGEIQDDKASLRELLRTAAQEKVFKPCTEETKKWQTVCLPIEER